jgi:predicted TIM-barrel fold metal-dependent hydrolase
VADFSEPQVETPMSWAQYIDNDWLARRQEAALEPELEIVDPHHHLWPWLDYGLKAFLDDVHSGHRVTATVHLETGIGRLESGPSHLRPVGETEHLLELIADPVLSEPGQPDVCAGIVGLVELTDDPGDIDEALDAHVAAGRDRFKGIRLNAFHSDDFSWLPGSRPGMLADPVVREGFARVAARGLTCDMMLLHPQLPELVDFAAAFPDTKIVLNHLGGFIGRAAYREAHPDAYEVWRRNILSLRDSANVFIKLGGLTCNFFAGPRFHLEAVPPSSETLADYYRPFVEPCIEAFGAERCMFESNFPADKQQCSYAILWNAFKRLAAGASADEKAALFAGTARQVYGLR